jgi:diguanylate cyclase (GGDEF)-like protein
MIATWLQTIRRNLRAPSARGAIALVAALILLIVEILIFNDVNSARDRALDKLQTDARISTETKSRELSQVLNDLYINTRTIAMLPAVRRAAAINRASVAEDSVKSGRFSATDAETVAQLYLHLAEVLSVSEVYIVYDGFKPQRGEVPFLMFDSVIVERFRNLNQRTRTLAEKQTAPELPEEVEEEEYAQLVEQLTRFRRENPWLPPLAPQGMPILLSPPLITCDNSQYLSPATCQQRDRTGMLLSVPIYDQTTAAFKGLVTAVVRLNVLEARLLGLQTIAVTPAEQAKARAEGLDTTIPADYALTHQASGVLVADRRNAGLQDILAGRSTAGLTVRKPLEGPAGSAWVLTRYTPQAAFDALHDTARRHFVVRSLTAIGLLAVLVAMALVLATQRRNAALLRELADFDALTGLPNRRQLDRTMNAGLRAAAAEGAPLMLIMVDLDNFKTINDVHGHHIGDMVLIEVARRFQKQLRSSDSVYDLGDDALAAAASIGRLGGDEFLILLPGVASDAAAAAISERLLSALAVPMLLDGRTIQARASLGVAFYPEHGETTTQLMRCADQAMYEAKRAEDSAVVLFQRDVKPEAMRRIRLTRDLREALANEQFELHYQPIVNLARERVDSVEALLRWRHPEFGIVSPSEFVPLLERSGLIVAVGLWTLRKACEQLLAWRATGEAIESVAVNVSVVQLSHSDFSRDALEVVDRTGIERSRVTVEVTESVLMENSERSIDQLCALRAAGMRIAMDDFGTGYSSLSYLRRLPVQVMKIDRSLLIDAINPSGRVILVAMVRLSAELGLDCVVEGVETLEQFRLLRDLGCPRLQGYLFARPLPAHEVTAAARRIRLQEYVSQGGSPTPAESGISGHLQAVGAD